MNFKGWFDTRTGRPSEVKKMMKKWKKWCFKNWLIMSLGASRHHLEWFWEVFDEKNWKNDEFFFSKKIEKKSKKNLKNKKNVEKFDDALRVTQAVTQVDGLPPAPSRASTLVARIYSFWSQKWKYLKNCLVNWLGNNFSRFLGSKAIQKHIRCFSIPWRRAGPEERFVHAHRTSRCSWILYFSRKLSGSF